MNSQELIKLNNKKREKLNEENLKYYEDMLVYLRLSILKSKQETEKLLTELLDHLLEAQEEGKDFTEVFGDDPKQYANELLGEIPKSMTKERFNLFLLGSFSFFASVLIFNGLIDTVMYYIFGKGSAMDEVYLGTAIVQSSISLLIAFFFLFIVMEYLKWSMFKNINKYLEFFYLWLISALSIGVFVLPIYFLPDFGTSFEVPVYSYLIAGILLGLIVYGIFKLKGNSKKASRDQGSNFNRE